MIESKKLGMASALCAGLLWFLCSVLVALFPHSMLQMTAHMIHVDLVDIDWTLTWFGFLVGLLGWTILAGVTGTLLAGFYNYLVGRDTH